MEGLGGERGREVASILSFPIVYINKVMKGRKIRYVTYPSSLSLCSIMIHFVGIYSQSKIIYIKQENNLIKNKEE